MIEFLRKKECKRTASDVLALGNSFTQSIKNALWTTDGYHEVFTNLGFFLLSLATLFVSYNHPKLSKHRKRDAENQGHGSSGI